MTVPNMPRAVGYVGKLPARPDFVRQNIGVAIGAELDRWLVASVQTLQQAKLELPAAPIRFVYGAARQDSVAVGVMRASRDQVGRAFPLCIFSSLSGVDAARSMSALPLAHAGFLDAATALLQEIDTLSLEELTQRTLALTPPGLSELEAQREAQSALLSQTAAGVLLSSLLRAEAVDSRDYALYTLCSATASVQAAPPAGAPTVLDCPLHAAQALPAWLELVARRLQWKQHCPSYAWCELPRPRLLLALGHASDQLLQLVADPQSKSARLWPLITQRPEAASRASEALGAAGTGRLDARDESVDAYWARLAALRV